ncbi:MAG: hypothetical protein WCE80_10435, partial [Acidimicrobiia bacterium]
LLERIMSVELEKREGAPARGARMRWLPAAAVVVLLVAVAGVLASLNGEPTSMELAAGGEDPMMSCIQFSVEELAKAPLAFEGTVISSEGEKVTLNVDTWFTGGDTDQVVLNAPQGLEALIGGMPFVAGETYLISAYDGNVNYCGFSGPATPELRSAFEAAFGA